MTIREGKKEDFSQVVALYKEFYNHGHQHHLFSHSEKHIIEHLKKLKDPFLVNDQGEIRAALFMVHIEKQCDHCRWKLIHFAYSSEEDGQKLLDAVEKKIKSKSKTTKIELTISENEPGLEFLLANKYKKEGNLENHYRWGESCFILGKSLS